MSATDRNVETDFYAGLDEATPEAGGLPSPYVSHEQSELHAWNDLSWRTWNELSHSSEHGFGAGKVIDSSLS